MVSLALYQPDIPQNTGTILRLGACLGVSVHVIEPTGFIWSEKSLKRAGMDYLEQADIIRHRSYETFHGEISKCRLVLLSTRGATPYTEFSFQSDDVLMLGRESAGVPEAVHAAADATITVPMNPETRSLNVAVAAAMVLGEALRQCGQFP
ncbi:MAG: tRNA (cytidine(34)-2'-O)-methyltransferase [Rhizobiales bacterium]|nr:tRNA (cytidine(34)-2'-O)-methyltransferase [Hyphomicrobiales bacterium]